MAQSPVIELLHRADALVPQFNASHGRASQLAHATFAADSQINNLQTMMSRQGQSLDPGSIRERTMVKLNNTIEEALAGIRRELLNMEQVVEQLKELLFQVEVFLADPSNSLRFAGTPAEALQHVSTLFDSYQSELLEKREIMAAYGAEEITAEQFAQSWKVMQEVQNAQDAQMDDLLSGMAGW